MRPFAGFFAAFLLLCTASGAAAAPGFEAGVRGIYWFPDLDAQVQTFDPAVGGTRFDVRDDLGVGDEEFLSGEAFLRVGRIHFRLGYTPVSFDGSNTLSRTIVFNGQTFSVADNVVTSLDMDMIDGEIQVDLLRPSLGVASAYLGIVAKVKYVDGEVVLQSSALTERETFSAPVPMFGLAAGFGFLKDLARVDARVTGIAYSDNHLFEADGFVSIVPFPFLRVQGGYRWIDLELDEDDVLVDLTLKGPYAGLQLSF